MACFEDDCLVVVGLSVDVWELVIVEEDEDNCFAAVVNLVPGDGCSTECEDGGCLAVVGVVAEAGFLTGWLLGSSKFSTWG